MLLRWWIQGISIIREPNNIGAVQSMFRRLHPGDVSWRPELGVLFRATAAEFVVSLR
jgi:hypothetical protein